MSDRHVAALARVEQRLDDELQALRTERRAMRTLLLKIGWVLEQPCWRTYGALATLLNDINDLIGVE